VTTSQDIDFDTIPFFAAFDENVKAFLRDKAETVQLDAGRTLFAEGDPATWLILPQSGQLMLSRDAIPIGLAKKHDLLDLIAVLGGLPHTQRAIAQTNCTVMRWNMAELTQNNAFSDVVRRYLAENLTRIGSRVDELEAPVHYVDESAQPHVGPFVFPNTTMVMALCDANLDFLRPLLPPDLTVFRAAWRKHDSIFIALAQFRDAHPASHPNATFSYTETTVFVPVRYKRQLGFYPAYIYPSAYEPILLGREIYGFPKRLGLTAFTEHDPNQVQFTVDGSTQLALTYRQSESASEPRLIRAMGDWLGVEGRLTETAFRIGDTVLDTMQVGLKRRMGVFNHKRVLSAKAIESNRVYDINQLTQAVFTVEGWHSIEQLTDAQLRIADGPLLRADVQLREAYKTCLDMRLSTGRILKDYRIDV